MVGKKTFEVRQNRLDAVTIMSDFHRWSGGKVRTIRLDRQHLPRFVCCCDSKESSIRTRTGREDFPQVRRTPAARDTSAVDAIEAATECRAR